MRRKTIEEAGQHHRKLRKVLPIGTKFENWTTLEENQGALYNPETRILCRCTCGTERSVQAERLVRGNARGCGCRRNTTHGIFAQVTQETNLGDSYGAWTVIAPGIRLKPRQPLFFLCRCNCGNERQIEANELRKGKTTSCGKCEWKYRVELSPQQLRVRLYGVWKGIKQRCTNPKSTSYKHYGARSISICANWSDSFLIFYEWACATGYQQNLQIDRKDVNGNYEPGNCRWVTASVNASENKRPVNPNCPHAILITAFGETKAVGAWVRDPRCEVSHPTLRDRVRAGIDPEKAMKKI